ncbi:MAG: lipoprotein [Candidatus Zixiibacteriota bacterium]
MIMASGCVKDDPTGPDGSINEDTYSITIGGDNSESAHSMSLHLSGGVVIAGEIDSNVSDAYVAYVGTNDTLVWDRTFGGNDTDRLFGIITAANGDLVGVGTSARDFWIIRISPAGDLIWQRTYDVGPLDEGAGITEANNGDLLLAGTFLVTLTSFDKHLIRVTSTGDVIWSRTFDHAQFDAVSDVIATSDGGFVIVGQSSNPQGGAAQTQVFKIDSLGNELWNKQYGTSGEYSARDIALFPDGRIVVVGGVNSNGPSGLDPYVLLLSATGEQLDEYVIARPNYNDAGGVAIAADGNLVVAGTSSEPGRDREVYLFKLQLDGTVQWERTYGDVFSDRGSDVVISGDRIYTCGTSEREKGCCTDVRLIKTDLDGLL